MAENDEERSTEQQIRTAAAQGDRDWVPAVLEALHGLNPEVAGGVRASLVTEGHKDLLGRFAYPGPSPAPTSQMDSGQPAIPSGDPAAQQAAYQLTGEAIRQRALARPGPAFDPNSDEWPRQVEDDAQAFLRIHDKFVELRHRLGLTAGLLETGPGIARASASEPGNMPEVTDALKNAEAESSWYYSSHPEWEQIRGIYQKWTEFMGAVPQAAGPSWAEMRQDPKVHGWINTIGARVCRSIGNAAYSLAGKLEQAGLRRSRAWRAMNWLHRAAADEADRLMGYLPAGRRLDGLGDIRQRLAELRQRDTRRATDGKTADRGEVATLTNGLAMLEQAYASGSAAPELYVDPAWAQIGHLLADARQTASQPGEGILRADADARDLGGFRAVWLRSCELVFDLSQEVMGRLETTGKTGSAGWHAASLVGHAAENHSARLIGIPPVGRHAARGTSDVPAARKTAGRPVRAEAAEPDAGLTAGVNGKARDDGNGAPRRGRHRAPASTSNDFPSRPGKVAATRTTAPTRPAPRVPQSSTRSGPRP